MFPTNVLIIQFVLFIMPERLGTILSTIFPGQKIFEATFFRRDRVGNDGNCNSMILIVLNCSL